MSITKKYLKTKPICKVTFKISPEDGKKYSSACLLGDFNNWDTEITPFQKLKNGGFTVTLDLDSNKQYKFRYLYEGKVWSNDPEADKNVPTPFGDSEDSVIVL